MEIFEGIYEDGVVRFPTPIALPDRTKVTVTPQADADSNVGATSLDRIYELLDQSCKTGIPDLAARHNEHQP